MVLPSLMMQTENICSKNVIFNEKCLLLFAILQLNNWRVNLFNDLGYTYLNGAEQARLFYSV